jgi:hypothetical protein
MYMPDAIAAYTVNDELYLVTGTEGDGLVDLASLPIGRSV